MSPEPDIGDLPITMNAQSPMSDMFSKRKVSEVHYLRNSMNLTELKGFSIKGQGLIKKDNLMSPTGIGGEIKPR